MKRFPRIPQPFEGSTTPAKVRHDVEVREIFQAVENDVVAGVDDNGQQARVHHFIKTEEQF